MDGIEHGTEHFIAAIQVVQIATGEVLTGVAIALFIQRTGIETVLGVADLDGAFGGEQVAVTRVTRGHHTVEHVHPATYAFDEVFWLAHAHQVTGRVVGHPSG